MHSCTSAGIRDSFTKALRRHVHKPAETCGELLAAIENDPPPKADLNLLGRIVKHRAQGVDGARPLDESASAALEPEPETAS
ncbi:MAG: hypothetical protein KGS61_02530 [Verrucomicrobia bacterium]|nr:hypothetical protein [Verrucomicrobiota bacterium]